MYIKYSAKLTGTYRRALRELFQTNTGNELGHIQFLADNIASLRGDPATVPSAVPPAEEPPEMLQQALMVEEQAIYDYSWRIRQAEACGEFSLMVGLEKRLADKIRHKEAIEHVRAIAPPLVQMDEAPEEQDYELV